MLVFWLYCNRMRVDISDWNQDWNKNHKSLIEQDQSNSGEQYDLLIWSYFFTLFNLWYMHLTKLSISVLLRWVMGFITVRYLHLFIKLKNNYTCLKYNFGLPYKATYHKFRHCKGSMFCWQSQTLKTPAYSSWLKY